MSTHATAPRGRDGIRSLARFSCPALVLSLLCLLLSPSITHAQTGARPAGKAQPFPEEYTLEQVGAWGGEVGAFVKDGNIGYVGSGQRLVVLDMSNLNNLVEIASLPLGSVVRDVKVRDGYAYVVTDGHHTLAADDAGLADSAFHVMDVHNPDDPRVVWSNPLISNGFHDGEGIELYGNLAFLQRQDGRISAADITDPTAPTFLAHIGLRLEHPHGGYIDINEWDIEESYAFAAERSGTNGLGFVHIYDLTTIDQSVLPLMPHRVASVPFFLNREVTGITVEDGWAYVSVLDLMSAGDNEPAAELWAIDISEPTAPIKMGTFDDFPQRPGTQLWGLGDLSVSGGRLYVSNESDETPGNIRHSLTIFDVATDPGQPVRLGTYNTHGSVFGVVGENDVAYLMDHGEGLIAVDCADPAAPSPLGNFHSPATLGVMCKRDDLMYISDYWNGMTILDVSDKSNPQIVSVYQAEENLGIGNTGLALDDDGYAYLAAGSSGLDVIDISVPEHPTLVGRFAFPSDGSWRVAGVAVHENPDQKVAVLSFSYGPEPNTCVIVMCLDVTNPSSITEISRTCAGGQTPAYFEQDGYGTLYSVGRIDSAHILKIDYSDPTDMNTTALGGSEWELGGDNSTAMTFDHDRSVIWHTVSHANFNELDHLYAIDLSDPLTPFRISDTGFVAPGAVAMHPQGMILAAQADDFLGEPGNRVLLLNVDNPAAPEPLASAVLPFPGSASTAQSYTHALGDETGIYITRSFTLGEFNNTGLSIFGLHQAIDRNGDGQVGTRDLAFFIEEVRMESLMADLNRDGRVEHEDVLVFVKMYLELIK